MPAVTTVDAEEQREARSGKYHFGSVPESSLKNNSKFIVSRDSFLVIKAGNLILFYFKLVLNFYFESPLNFTLI